MSHPKKEKCHAVGVVPWSSWQSSPTNTIDHEQQPGLFRRLFPLHIDMVEIVGAVLVVPIYLSRQRQYRIVLSRTNDGQHDSLPNPGRPRHHGCGDWRVRYGPDATFTSASPSFPTHEN
jgi:hypothetical protein